MNTISPKLIEQLPISKEYTAEAYIAIGDSK